MAINSSTRQAEQLAPRAARLAGGVSAVLGLLGAVALLAYMLTHRDQATYLAAYQVGWIVVAAMVVAVSVELLRGRVWAQRMALSFWLTVLGAAVVVALAALLWGTPGWWPDEMPLTSVLLPVMAGAGVAAALAHLASAGRSRLRYASVVTISAAAALTLTLVVNMIAQTDYKRKPMETLGRFGLSEQSKRILDELDGTCRLTCVYNAPDEAAADQDFSRRIWELMQEMAEHSDKVQVANITSDAEKAELIARLRTQLGTQADRHAAFLKKFIADGPGRVDALQAEQGNWAMSPGRSFLDLWAVPAEIAWTLKESAGKLQQALDEIERELRGPALPDYKALVDKVTDALKPARDDLEAHGKRIQQLEGVLAAVSDKARRDGTVESVDKCLAAVKAMAGAIGAPKDPVPKDPTKALKAFESAAGKAAAQSRSTARMLEVVGGLDNAELLRANTGYQLSLAAGMLQVRMDLVAFFGQYLSEQLDGLAAEAQALVKVTKAEFQAETIGKLRSEMERMVALASQVCKMASQAVEKLGVADEPSKVVLAAAKGGKLFEQVLAPIRETLDAAEKLPELEQSSLTLDITENNIVIVEVAGKAEVAGFEDIWPRKVQPMGPGPSDDALKIRTFVGDSAISSRILKMTSEPFATVLLTYHEAPPQMRQMAPPPDISLRDISALRKRLEEANFAVAEWDLTKDKPAGEPGRPQVLLVLPPSGAPPMPPFGGPRPQVGFGPEQQKKLTEAIDSGTPAVFLATYSWPRRSHPLLPPTAQPYALGDYLRDEWGIDAKTDYRVIPAVRDDSAPDARKLNITRFGRLNLNAFTDHPIGRPLQAQRVLWNDLCPIVPVRNETGEPAAPPKGVTLRPLLEIPDWWPATWATARIMHLLDQMHGEGGLVSPDYAAGDMQPGFSVAMAATRGGEGVGPARIVVLGTGASLTDACIKEPFPVLDANGNVGGFLDPPMANADLAVNSVFWLAGMKDKIAAGPLRIKPVRNVSRRTMSLLWGVFVVGLPLGVLAVGGAVLLVRRR